MITFTTIKRKNIFAEDFSNLTQDNTICFSADKIAIIYGPNGIGKSSLASVFSNKPETELIFSFNGNSYTSKEATSFFHVINDQNGRNIIKGSTDDFVLGDNIRREFELKNEIDDGFENLFNKVLIPQLKNTLGISTINSPLLSKVTDNTLIEYINDLANRQSKGKGIDRKSFLKYIDSLIIIESMDFEKSKLDFVINDYSNKNSIIKQLERIVIDNITIDRTFTRIGECTDAISLLTKYSYLHECVVCDNPIDYTTLLQRKKSDKESFFDKLNDSTKPLLDQISKSIGQNDPFNIIQGISQSANSEDINPLIVLLRDISLYFDVINRIINNLFASCVEDSNLISNFNEYEQIIKEKPQLTGEDVLFIEKFVNDCIDRKIELIRDSDGNLELQLGQRTFLNQERLNLSLSNGEQNFISIAFELLKAQKSQAQVVVFDDPISSFDSIYKNKIAYAILKFLQQKNQILLTHNTDLITLLEHQKQNSFNLYLLNNTPGERNGFISVNKKEQSLILYLNKLIDFFREDVHEVIKDEKKFLIAMVPFMRSFSQIVNKQEIKNNLTEIMHGYGTSSVNLSNAYHELFDCSFFTNNHIVSVQDILDLNSSDWEIVDKIKYPLLNRTFCHILTYLYLRLLVEKTLVEKYHINTNQNDMLSRIIINAFREDNDTNINNRVFLLSRKTLLNEFNHFEQGLNLFQPAIDITNTALLKERDDIIAFLEIL